MPCFLRGSIASGFELTLIDRWDNVRITTKGLLECTIQMLSSEKCRTVALKLQLERKSTAAAFRRTKPAVRGLSTRTEGTFEIPSGISGRRYIFNC